MPPETSTLASTAAPVSTERPAPSDIKTPAPGARRIWRAFFYSMHGLGAALKHEQAFRQEMALAAVLVPVAALLPASLEGKALMIGSVLLVLMVELLNSGLEWCVDLAAQQQRHPFAKRAKDMGSAAVFVSLVNCLVVWVLVLAQAIAAGRFAAW
jgi:diacylglycerol kinase (ATP)